MRTEAISSQYFASFDSTGGKTPEQNVPTFEEKLSNLEGINRKFVPIVQALHRLNATRAESGLTAYTEPQKRAILSTAYLEVENPEKGEERAKFIDVIGITDAQFSRDVWSLPDFINEKEWDEYEKLIDDERNKLIQSERTARAGKKRAKEIEAQYPLIVRDAVVVTVVSEFLAEGKNPNINEILENTNNLLYQVISKKSVKRSLQRLYEDNRLTSLKSLTMQQTAARRENVRLLSEEGKKNAEVAQVTSIPIQQVVSDRSYLTATEAAVSRKPQNTAGVERFRELLSNSYARDPEAKVRLIDLAREAGISISYAKDRYNKFSETMPVPPLDVRRTDVEAVKRRLEEIKEKNERVVWKQEAKNLGVHLSTLRRIQSEMSEDIKDEA